MALMLSILASTPLLVPLYPLLIPPSTHLPLPLLPQSAKIRIRGKKEATFGLVCQPN